MNDIVGKIDELFIRNGLTETDIRIFENHIIRSLENRLIPLLNIQKEVKDIQRQIKETVIADPHIQYLKAVFETRLNCINTSIMQICNENNSIKEKISRLESVVFSENKISSDE